MNDESTRISTNGGATIGDGSSVPAIIVAAGDYAVEQYRAFFDSAIKSAATRMTYRNSLVRFFRWADVHGLSLQQIASTDVLAYLESLSSRAAPNTIEGYATALRSFFRHFASTGVLASNPFTLDSSALVGLLPAKPGFDLLALLAMLSHMEQESLQMIFEDEATASALLEQVRWPDGPVCQGCASDKNEMIDTDCGRAHRCLSCGRQFTVLAGSMFEKSPLALRHWLRLLHQETVATERAPDAEMTVLVGIDQSGMVSHRSLLRLILNRERVPTGAELEKVLAEKDRQLVNDQFARSVIRYAELTAAKETLLKAKTEKSEVPDLPPGVLLDEALARVEELIAEEDRWQYYLEDGYIARTLADEAPAAGATQGQHDG